MLFRSPTAAPGAKLEAEKILDGEVNGRRPPNEQEAARSFAAAEDLTKRTLGDQARTYQPDIDSGKYRGEIIAETDHHVVQQLSARSTAAHAKHLLPEGVAPGQNLLVAYSNSQVQLKPNQACERSKALAR